MSEIKEFYVGDLVYKFDEKSRITFGIVTECFENSDNDEYPTLQKGQIIVWWHNSNRKQICKQNNVRLMSRTIIPGDIVRRLIDGKETQRGYCKSVKQTATVQIVDTNKIIENISTLRLPSVKMFDSDDAVCLGNKFGRVQVTHQLVKMKSKCGSIVEVQTFNNYHTIKDLWSQKTNGSFLEPCYPSQTVICVPMELKEATWLKKSKVMKGRMEVQTTFTIISVEYTLLEVWWHNYKDKGHMEHCDLVTDKIKRLKVIPYSNVIEINDRNLLQLRSSDVLINKSEWIRRKSLIYRTNNVPKLSSNKIIKDDEQNEDNNKTNNIDGDHDSSDNLLKKSDDDNDDWYTEDESDYLDENQTKTLNNNNEIKNDFKSKFKFSTGSILPVDVICTDTKVSVVWQDGTEETDIPTTQLYFSSSLDDHEFFPGEWVISMRICGCESIKNEYGVIQKVDNIQRTAIVKWFQVEGNTIKPYNNGKNEEGIIEELSVYDLEKHTKFLYRPGCVVKSKPTESYKMGRVVDSQISGYVTVNWIDGTTEDCCPQNIELIPDSEEFEFSVDDTDYDDSFSVLSGSWDTESVESFEGDISEQLNLQMMASKVDFIRDRIIFLKQIYKKNNISKDFTLLKELLLVYDNSRCLDKYLGTGFFSLDSKHFQTLLKETKKLAKRLGYELKGLLFLKDGSQFNSVTKLSHAADENILKMLKIESQLNAQIKDSELATSNLTNSTITATNSTTNINSDTTTTTTTTTLDGAKSLDLLDSDDKLSQDTLSMELLLMLKIRMDLVYAEIISRIGGPEALSVLSTSRTKLVTASNSTIESNLSSVNVTPSDDLEINQKFSIENNDLTKVEIIKTIGFNNESFIIVDDEPTFHKYYLSTFKPADLKKFVNVLQKEYKLLMEALPDGVWVKTYSSRTDLLSLLIRGPDKTPYEDGLFLFDIQLKEDYPRSPPVVHFISYSSERLNPNLYVEGKVCVSLLGTWKGRGSEVWGSNSTLLQLIVSIQGLILVAEPYYNEAGYEKQTNTQQGYENSRTYNELVILKLVQSMTDLANSIPLIFRKEIIKHLQLNGMKMCQRLNKYCNNEIEPEFPLLPVSKGLKLSLEFALKTFKLTLTKVLANPDSIQ